MAYLSISLFKITWLFVLYLYWIYSNLEFSKTMLVFSVYATSSFLWIKHMLPFLSNLKYFFIWGWVYTVSLSLLFSKISSLCEEELANEWVDAVRRQLVKSWMSFSELFNVSLFESIWNNNYVIAFTLYQFWYLT